MELKRIGSVAAAGGVPRPLERTRWLVASDELAWADGVAQCLRIHGAQVHLVDADGRGLSRLSGVDAQVLLLSRPASSALRRALDAHAGLRWATPSVVEAQQAWPGDQSLPSLEVLQAVAAGACAADEALLRVARGPAPQFEASLEPLGPARLLRVLDAASDVFVVQWTRGTLRAHVALGHGLWLGASFEERMGRGRVEGVAALSRVLSLRESGCLVLRGGRIQAQADAQPMGDALRAALDVAYRAHAQVPPERSRTRSTFWTTLSRAAAAPSLSLRRDTGRLARGVSAPTRPVAGPLDRLARARPWLVRGAAALGLALGTYALLHWQGHEREASAAVQPTASLTLTVSPRPSPYETHVEPLPPRGDEAPDVTAPGSASPEPPELGASGELEPGAWVRSRRLTRRARHAEDPARAHALWVQALEADPNNPHAVEALAREHLARGELDSARALAEKAVRLRPSRTAYRLLLGDVCMRAGRAQEAQRAYRAALRLRPQSNTARVSLQRAEHVIEGLVR